MVTQIKTMETKYVTKTKEEKKNFRKIFSAFMVLLFFFYMGLFEVMKYFDYTKQLGLEKISGSLLLPKLALSLGQIFLLVLVIVLSYFAIFAFLLILDSIIPTLSSRKEVLEKIKGNEEKISDLTKKNKELNTLIK